MWIAYALLSAVFAALTAVFAKIGIADVNSTLATAIRTVVVRRAARHRRHYTARMAVSCPLRACDRRLMALLLQGAANG